MGGRDNFGRKSQVLTKVVNTFVSQVAVVVLPVESDADVSPRLKRLHQHENFQVGGSFNVRMGLGASVLLDNAHTLLEEVAKGSDTVFLGDKHLGLCSSYFEITRKLLELWIEVDWCDSLEKHQTDRREMKVAKQACSKRGKK